MKKIILLCVLPFIFLAGCDGKDSKTPASNSPALTNKPKTAEAIAMPPVTLSTSKALPEPATLALGESVYKSTCSICHQSGLRGAPRIGSVQDWEHRLAQGKETLYKHATHGFRGDKGSMPSRGSNAKLSETEVKAAVDYMVEHAIPAWSLEK